MRLSDEQPPAVSGVDNPYLRAYRAAPAHERSCTGCDNAVELEPGAARSSVGSHCPDNPPGRHALITRYAFPVLDENALAEIAALDKAIVDFGAGAGYLSWLISQTGTTAHAYDLYPPSSGQNHWHEVAHYPVHAADLGILNEYGADFALLLSWPPFREPMARQCLRSYAGDTLIYIGEGSSSGCTASDDFFEELDRSWRIYKDVEIPTWDSIHDRMQIYLRKGVRTGSPVH